VPDLRQEASGPRPPGHTRPEPPAGAARACDDPLVPGAPFEIRPAREEDRRTLAVLFAEVAAERDGIATEPPVDVDARAAGWGLDGTLVAVAGTELVGTIHVEASRHGFGEIGMLVAREWRGRGVGSALLSAAIERAREQGLHKLSLGVFAHNDAAIALYRKHGFVEEGRRVKQYRRSSGELWDALDMGLLL
jgi:ribosomal protein S18 acetylase RimI-like enzyme